MSGAFGTATRKSAVQADRSGADSRRHEAPEEAVGVPRFLQDSVQFKLTVGATDDGFERQADAVASLAEQETATGLPEGENAPQKAFDTSARPSDPPDTSSRQTASAHSAGPFRPQPQSAEHATPRRTGGTPSRVAVPAIGRVAPVGLQRSTTPDAGSTSPLPADGAAPMPEEVRSRVEPILGADLSGVRVHSGPAAARAAASFQARAFTHGSDIWLGERARPDDVELMAHESTHVVQQRAAPQGTVQRRPEDYIHPEDGSAVQSNMATAVEEELADVDESDQEDAPDPSEMPSGERSRLKGELADDGELPVDRAAEAQPEVESAADQAKSEADQAAEALAEGTEKEPGAGGEGEAGGAAAAAGAAAELAANALPPGAPTPVEPIVPDAPQDSEGATVAADAPADAAAVALTAELQRMRLEGTDARARAAVIHGNAGVMRGNLSLAQAQVDAADAALTSAEGNVEARREIASQGRDALAVSEEKAAQVAGEAPDFVEQAGEAHEDSGPMASEAAETAGDAGDQDPDDEEAAEKMEGVGSGMSGVSADAGTVDGAVTQTQQRAESLVEDAAEAQEKNADTAGKLDATDEALNQSEDRLTQLGEQNQLADSQVAALMSGPGQMDAGADELDAGALAIIDHSSDLESDLRASEETYQGEMGSIPGAKAVAAAADTGGGAEGVVQRSPEDAYADRVKVDLLGAFRSPPSAAALREQEQRRLAADTRRRERIRDIERQANGDFSSLSALDRMSIALELTGENLWSGASEINWPNMAEQVILSFIDPRVSLEGVVSGLNGVLSGAANLFSLEQWERDPLGNLLKSAADIATGLTTILGSIAGLCTAILVILGALAIFTFGAMGPAFAAASAFLGPIISTVGGWALVTAAIAAELHALVFIKNLIDAATADTADAVVNESDQMTTDATEFASAASEVVLDRVMDVGGARLANTPTGQRIGGAIEGIGRDFDMIPPPRITPDMDLPPAAALGEAPPAAALGDGAPAAAAADAPVAAGETPPAAAVAETPATTAAPDTAAATAAQGPPTAVAPEPAVIPPASAPPAAAAAPPSRPLPPPPPPPAPAPRTPTPDTPPAPRTPAAPEGAAATTAPETPRPAPETTAPESPATAPETRATAPESPAPGAAAAEPAAPAAPEAPGSATTTAPEAGSPSGTGGEPPTPTGGDGGSGGAPERLGGATAEGVGADFNVETFPPTRMPEVEYRRPRPGAEGPAGTPEGGSRATEAEASTRPPDAETAGRAPESDTDLTPEEADLLADAIDSGDLTDLPPHLRRRAEIAEAHAEASGRSYEGEQGPHERGDVDRPRGGADIPTNPMDLPEIQEAALSAQAALADLPPGQGAKTVGGVEGSPSTTSGSAGSKVDTVERAHELAGEAGAVREHPFDRATGGPGYYHGSHAEIQTITNHPGRPVAVSKPMCGGCQDFFRRHAQTSGQRIVVADPDGVRVFLEDGSVHMTPHGDLRGRDTSTSALPQPTPGAPVGRSR